MAKSHNKKRNIGIIYEQIVQFICKKIMENDEQTSEKALKIIKESFKEDSQLYKEYKLFKALAETKSITSPLANSIIFEAKKASNNMFNKKALEKEKSALIKKLNYTFGKGKIFEESVENYRIYATIQTLLNEWRNPENANFELATKYEIKLHNFLIETPQIDARKNNLDLKNVDNVTYKLMTEIFDKKYLNSLNENQQKLLSLYAKNSNEQLEENFRLLKNDTITILKEYIKNCDNKILIEKSRSILDNISKLQEDNTTKENLRKYLTLSKLKEELLGEE